MSKNEFLPFGTAANANVLPNADYQALPARSAGFGSGVAKSEELNTVWRQSSTMAAVLGQFLANKTGQDVLDNGNVEALLGQLESAIFSASPGRLINIQTFTSSGTYTPTPGTKRILVEVQGAGGGGAGTSAANSTQASLGSGGSGGGYAKSNLPVASVSGASIVIGSPGIGGSGTSGSDGGNTSVGALITANGGQGGYFQTAATPPFGATGVTGSTATGGNIVNIPGNSSAHSLAPTINSCYASNGGGSVLGVGGFGTGNVNTPGRDAGGYGGGGGGAVSQNGAAQRGGNGSGGIVIIWEFS